MPPKMPRRRSKLFMVCAVVIVILLYRLVQNSWDDQPSFHSAPPPKAPVSGPVSENAKLKVDNLLKKVIENQAGRLPQEPLVEDKKSHVVDEKPPTSPPVPQDETGEDKHSLEVGVPVLKENGDKEILPPPSKTEKTVVAGAGVETPVTGNDAPSSIYQQTGESEEVAMENGQLSWKAPPTQKEAPEIHWSKIPERYPVSKESLITLPTGTPKKIPKIQYEFRTESEEAKSKRTERLTKVKHELERSWTGYKEHAWMHDELRPVTGAFRDPFCGWAATLVDSLDTLWIAGMKEEFDEAAKAVKNIDFTYTARMDIQVFETTIRYLGGLVAAFDVSGGKKGEYPILLEKAVELAEVLMGIFDTPNRMPILYYHWQPAYVSQPHRAGRAGVAELATLSMEFTRLAQLTGEDKYYDAVARITNGLVELQAAGTTIPGLFPENLDVSGCNQTATFLREAAVAEAQRLLEEAEALEAVENPVNTMGRPPGGSKSRPGATDDPLEMRDGGPARPEANTGTTEKTTPAPVQHSKRSPRSLNQIHGPEYDCVEQGIVPANRGYESYHMGGGQDSAYEYFPKEYLLLGGLEPKYEKLHVDAVKAINDWLLYQPMIKDDKWDVLFPAKVATSAEPPRKDPDYEITHLTCFIGGMYGLGGKAFGRPDDIETAKKLTDGCVWAYQMTASGLMPEQSRVLHCPTLEKCEFNETLWWDTLDPSKDWRPQQILDWEKEQKQSALVEQEEKRKQAELKAAASGEEASVVSDNLDPEKAQEARKLQDAALAHGSDSLKAGSGLDPLAAGEPRDGHTGAIRKRAAIPREGDTNGPITEEPERGSQLPQSLKDKLGIKDEAKKPKETIIPEASHTTPMGAEAQAAAYKGRGRIPTIPKLQPDRASAYVINERPPTHKEFVENKIEQSQLPPGFVSIDSRAYILRPEAIESVWYMYRITGDPSWMDKGWEMFEATVRVTRTAIANSAVDNVMIKDPEPKNEMESFWLAETLKYYYLLFSEPDVISLDEWVLNTEAHPFRRPV